MEWTDEQIHAPGRTIENWNEGKVVTALQNYMRGRQNAKTLEYWPFTFKSFKAWFFNEILVNMLPSIRQNAITWLGKTRTGKSLGSKTIAFMQSKFEITQDQREEELIPSIATTKHPAGSNQFVCVPLLQAVTHELLQVSVHCEVWFRELGGQFRD